MAKRVSMMTFEISVMYDYLAYRKHWNNKGRYSAWLHKTLLDILVCTCTYAVCIVT